MSAILISSGFIAMELKMGFAKKSAYTRETERSARAVASQHTDTASALFNAKRLNASSIAPFFDAKGRFVHFCQCPGCKAWGCIGFDVDQRRFHIAVHRNEPDPVTWLGRWYCAIHAKEEEVRLSKAKENKGRAKVAAKPVKSNQARQGVLL